MRVFRQGLESTRMLASRQSLPRLISRNLFTFNMIL